jgi:hypothetical protein
LFLGESYSPRQLVLALSKSHVFRIHAGSVVVRGILKASTLQGLKESEIGIVNASSDGLVHAGIALATFGTVMGMIRVTRRMSIRSGIAVTANVDECISLHMEEQG